MGVTFKVERLLNNAKISSKRKGSDHIALVFSRG